MWVTTEGTGGASLSRSHSSRGFRSKKSNLTARTLHQGMRGDPSYSSLGHKTSFPPRTTHTLQPIKVFQCCL